MARVRPPNARRYGVAWIRGRLGCFVSVELRSVYMLSCVCYWARSSGTDILCFRSYYHDSIRFLFFLALSLCILTPREPFEPVSSCVRHSENFMDSVRAIVGCWSSLDEQGRSSLRVQISRQFWQVRLVVHLQQSAQIASSIYPLKDEGCTD